MNSTLQRDFCAPYLRIYIRRKKRDINERPGIDLCAVSTRECSLIQTSHLSLVLRPFARTFCHPSCSLLVYIPIEILYAQVDRDDGRTPVFNNTADVCLSGKRTRNFMIAFPRKLYFMQDIEHGHENVQSRIHV